MERKRKTSAAAQRRQIILLAVENLLAEDERAQLEAAAQQLVDAVRMRATAQGRRSHFGRQQAIELLWRLGSWQATAPAPAAARPASTVAACTVCGTTVLAAVAEAHSGCCSRHCQRRRQLARQPAGAAGK